MDEEVVEMRDERWRLCRLCQTVSVHDSRQWVQACGCPGQFHRQCLQYRVWACEMYRPRESPSCPWCQAPYRISPPKSAVITAFDTIARSYRQSFSRILCFAAHHIAVDSAAATFGLLILSRVYGPAQARALLTDMDALTAVTILHAIPLAAILINYIAWEDFLLRKLRRCSKFPVVGPMMPVEVVLEQQPSRPRSIVSFGALVGGLLLPVFAEVTGHFLFRSEESPVKRFLLGGAFFLLLRGIIYMYYQQKSFVRQANLAVADFVP